MEIAQRRLKEFKRCHKGFGNLVFHILGFTLIGLGIFYKEVFWVLGGALTQEIGHFYQYKKTGDKKDSPLHCFKAQLFFAYPLLAIIVLYVLYS